RGTQRPFGQLLDGRLEIVRFSEGNTARLGELPFNEIRLSPLDRGPTVLLWGIDAGQKERVAASLTVGNGGIPRSGQTGHPDERSGPVARVEQQPVVDEVMRMAIEAIGFRFVRDARERGQRAVDVGPDGIETRRVLPTLPVTRQGVAGDELLRLDVENQHVS